MIKDSVFAQGVFGNMVFGDHASNTCKWIRIMSPCEAGTLPENESFPVGDPFFEDAIVAIYGFAIIGSLVYGQTYLQEETFPPEPSGPPEDDEEEIDLSLVILDIPFSEATFAEILDHSVFERPITKVAGTYLSVVDSSLKLLKASPASFDGVFTVPKMPPYPKKFYIKLNVKIPSWGGSSATRISASDNSANFNFNTVFRIDSNFGFYGILEPFGATGGDYYLPTGDYQIEVERISAASTMKLDGVQIYNWTIPTNQLFSGDYEFTVADPANPNGNLNIFIKDVQIQYRYHGTPWWINSIIDFNFQEATPLATLDKSPIGHPTVSTNFSETVYKDLSIVEIDEYTNGLKMTRTDGDVSDGIRIYPVYVAAGGLSFEFYFEHNSAPGSSVAHSGTIFELQTSPSSIYCNMEHPLGDGDGYIGFYGATFDTEAGATADDYFRWIKCTPNVRRKYTVNYIGGVATVHVDGVLHLTGTCVDRSLVARQAFRIFGSNGSAIGLEWIIDSVIVTNNYYLDPSKTRVIPG